MIIKELELRGVFEIRLSPHFDERGFFTRTFDDETFRETQITRSWVQENQSHTFKSGTIRGLHFQFPPFSLPLLSFFPFSYIPLSYCFETFFLFGGVDFLTFILLS